MAMMTVHPVVEMALWMQNSRSSAISLHGNQTESPNPLPSDASPNGHKLSILEIYLYLV